ncbi:transcriptional regulator [Pyrodictium occultum]|uniref:Transcriptional regulator n=1 Tax=Pyrodictium occultum TaxID=2309 RepID=A0A0V8RW73_PYROC|nr:transcriptional regulator [Pyrodictium occultum]KSW12291.1 transcriptional regulator [Pyrodictium occultum]
MPERLDLANVPLRPASRREILLLETGLIVGTLYRPDIMELIRDPLERATWLDSLAVAAAALAREKAGYTVSQIAEELGRSETTIRAHLSGKTKAGKIVRETYEILARGQLELVIPFTLPACSEAEEELKRLKEENEKLRRELEKCSEVDEVRRQLEEIRSRLEELEGEKREMEKELERCRGQASLLEEARKLLCRAG